jgi:hypothetical protein
VELLCSDKAAALCNFDLSLQRIHSTLGWLKNVGCFHTPKRKEPNLFLEARGCRTQVSRRAQSRRDFRLVPRPATSKDVKTPILV